MTWQELMKFKRKDWDLSEVWLFCHFAMLILSLSMVVTCLVYVICKVEPPEDFPDSMPLPPVEKGRPPRQVLGLSLLWSLSLQKSNHATWKWWFSTTLKNQSPPQTEDFSWIFSCFSASSPVFWRVFYVDTVYRSRLFLGVRDTQWWAELPEAPWNAKWFPPWLSRLHGPAKNCSSSLRRCRCCPKWTRGVVQWLVSGWGFGGFLVISCGF